MTNHRLTFTNLLDDTNGVHQRYGRPSNSNFWLIMKDGTRVGNKASIYSTGTAQRLLDDLE